MGITNVIERQYKQKAVYWGNPLNDGQGGFTYDAPVEISCRWEDMNQVVTDTKENEITSRGLVYLKQDVDVEGMLYLGTLDELYDLAGESSAGQIDDPRAFFAAHKTAQIYTIKRFAKIPALGSTTDFLRQAYLTPSLSFGGF